MARFVWDKRVKDWVDAETYRPPVSAGIHVIGDISSFISPVTGREISSRRQLREHNRFHNVVDRREFKGHKFEKPKLPPVAPTLAQVFRERRGG